MMQRSKGVCICVFSFDVDIAMHLLHHATMQRATTGPKFISHYQPIVWWALYAMRCRAIEMHTGFSHFCRCFLISSKVCAIACTFTRTYMCSTRNWAQHKVIEWKLHMRWERESDGVSMCSFGWLCHLQFLCVFVSSSKRAKAEQDRVRVRLVMRLTLTNWRSS